MDDLKFVRSTRNGIVHVRDDAVTMCGMTVGSGWVDVGSVEALVGYVCDRCRRRVIRKIKG